MRLELVLEQRQHVGDDDVDVNERPIGGRRTRQRQESVDDLRRTERLPLDLLEQPRARILRIGALEQHLREARDAGQRRVHLVRDAGRQQTDRRHLLGDPQLLLELHLAVTSSTMTMVPHGASPASSALRSGMTAALTISVSPGLTPRASSGMRDSVAPAGRVTAGGTNRLDELARRTDRRVGGRSPRRARRRRARQRRVPPHHPVIQIDDEQAIVERLEDVLVEGTHPIDLDGLHVELAIEPGVLERGRNLTGDSRKQRHVLAAQRLAAVLAAEREHRDRALLRDARHEVVEAGVAPELDLLDGKRPTAVGSSSVTLWPSTRRLADAERFGSAGG